MLTIFTPTYNRAKLLSNLYKSLQQQTHKDFEWIIVDDASTDNTQSVIGKFIEEKNDFNIISLKQSHGGKHRAINLGVTYANFEWFFIVDSDDVLMDDAVEWIEKNILEAEKEKRLCGISGTKVLKTGNRMDGELLVDKSGYRDLSIYESYKINGSGDMAEIWKTKLLRQYPFPDYKGEYMCPESVVWGRMAANGYKIRYFNKPLYIMEYLDDGLTKTSSIDTVCKNFRYFCDYYSLIMIYGEKKYKMGSFYNFTRAAHRKKIKFGERAALLNLKETCYIKMYFLELPVYLLKRFICKAVRCFKISKK